MQASKIHRVGDVEIFHFSDMSSADGRGLVQQAINARRNAYAPYSGFKVGCALVSQSNVVFYGCNVEYAHYKVTHAERSALAAMVVSGQLNIRMLVLAGATADREFNLTPKDIDLGKINVSSMVTSCGDCRQIISEHCNGDNRVPILSVNTEGFVFRASIGVLLPHVFTLR
ncbi:hypothetical protein KKH39_04935 [Patescibacteria group bacterium]|nr:hypothetical protein [Patescibacteria group bacterium]